MRLFYAGLWLGQISEENIKTFVDEYEKEYLASGRPMEGAIENLFKLKERGCRLAIITNGQTVFQREKAEIIGVLFHVEFLLASEEVVKKPDANFFKVACEEMEVEESGCWMIGDDIDADVKGALGVGMTPVLFDPASDEEEKERLLGGSLLLPGR